jgi:vancomycin resistance protein VanW
MYPKPINRSLIRRFAGISFYTVYKYRYWYLSKISFANHINSQPMPEKIFSHQTPLMRKLRNVDMQLQFNKVKNLKIAVKKLNGLVIMPGETFSYWRLIGPTLAIKGYKKGMVLHNGTYKAGTGGGLCQLSNLVYWMTLHTPLTVIERWRHSYDVFPDAGRTLPFGTGATCSFPYIDLQFRNNTQEPFQLIVKITENDLMGEWRSIVALDHTYDVFEKNHAINTQAWGGYTQHNQIYRRITDVDGNVVAENFVAENNAVMMYEPFLETGL